MRYKSLLAGLFAIPFLYCGPKDTILPATIMPISTSTTSVLKEYFSPHDMGNYVPKGVAQSPLGVGIAYDTDSDGNFDLLAFYSFEGAQKGCPYVWYVDSDQDLVQNEFEYVAWDKNQDCEIDKYETIKELEAKELS